MTLSLSAQAGILQPVPAFARYVHVVLAEAGAPPQAMRAALARLQALADGDRLLVGIGPGVVAALGAQVPGLHELPALSGPGVDVPATPGALWCWLRGSDPGDLLLLTRQVQHALAPAFQVGQVVDAFRHAPTSAGHGRDLTGYEDGTENPEGEAAEAAALTRGAGAGLDGGSFVAVQQWLHDFDAFDAMPPEQQDHTIGRRRGDNEELDDAPPSAHVKRTAQEAFDPPAFILRRSMPWMQGLQGGLMFVAFGQSLRAFEAQMRRMAGQDDGIIDALFGMSRPLTSASFWCPPMRDGRIDLRQLGL